MLFVEGKPDGSECHEQEKENNYNNNDYVRGGLSHIFDLKVDFQYSE